MGADSKVVAQNCEQGDNSVFGSKRKKHDKYNKQIHNEVLYL